jgi:hypothetical protein
MRRTAVIVMLLTLLLGAVGCQHYAFVTGAEPGGVRIREWQHIWLFGRIPDEPFDLERACGRATLPSEFGSYVSFDNLLLRVVTLGIYAPRTAYAVCGR